MLIPNPVSESTKFFNEVLLQLFNDVYDAIPVVQFKRLYVSSANTLLVIVNSRKAMKLKNKIENVS